MEGHLLELLKPARCSAVARFQIRLQQEAILGEILKMTFGIYRSGFTFANRGPEPPRRRLRMSPLRRKRGWGKVKAIGDP